MNFSKFIKWLLLLASLGWAVYSSYGFMLLAKTFPTSSPTASALSTMQGYLLVFGPLVGATLLFFIQWPKRKVSDKPTRAE